MFGEVGGKTYLDWFNKRVTRIGLHTCGAGGNSKPVSLRAYALARAGRVDEARELQAMLADVSRTRYVPPYAEALVALGLNEDDRVFACLERAYEVRDVHLVFLSVDPKWDRLRDMPRFGALLEGCGFMTS